MNETVLRGQRMAQLEGGQASLPVREIFEGFPVERAGVRIDSIRHTPWKLLEHLRIAQWDIVQFAIDPAHSSPPWPDEHWPRKTSPESADEWMASVDIFLSDLEHEKELA